MAIGTSLFGQRWGFMIGDIGPLAGAIFLAVFGYVFFKFLRDLGKKTPAAGAFAFLLIYFSIIAVVPNFYDWLIDEAPFLEALLALAVIFAVFIAIKDMIKLFKSDKDQDFPGIRDSKEFISDNVDEADKKRRRAEEARDRAERKRAEAENERKRAEAEAKRAWAEVEASKSDEEKEAREKVADYKTKDAKEALKKEKKAEVDAEKAEGKHEKAKTSLEGLPTRTEELSTDVLKKQVDNRKKDVKKTLKKLYRELRNHYDKFDKQKDECQDKNYDELSEDDKKTYEDMLAFAKKDMGLLVNLLISFHNKEIKDYKFLNKLKQDKDKAMQKKFEDIIGDDAVIQQKYDLVNLLWSIYSVLIDSLSKKSKWSEIQAIMLRFLELVDKFMQLNRLN